MQYFWLRAKGWTDPQQVASLTRWLIFSDSTLVRAQQPSATWVLQAPYTSGLRSLQAVLLHLSCSLAILSSWRS